MKTFFSIVIWIYWAICIIAFFFIMAPLYVFTFPIDPYNQIPNYALKGLGWVMLKGNPGWTFDIKGADPQKITRPTIVVGNHQSFLDLPMAFLLPWNMKFVAKKALFKIPIFGWMIYMSGHLSIDRTSIRSAKKLDRLVEPILQGIPAMIYPEGTRSLNGKLKPFKGGAFKMANRYNFDILPVVFEGGNRAMLPGDWKMNYKEHFTISVLDPVAADSFQSEQELKEAVFTLIEQELCSLQSEHKTNRTGIGQ